MNIETYEVEELKGSEATTMAADSESVELIERLGLKGQKALCNPITGTRLPYRKMTKIEVLVFANFCPIHTRLEDYASGIIPLRVLQIAAHCRDEGFFKRMEVWHPEDVKTDPVLVGQRQEGDYEHLTIPYLLARWGDMLKPFEELTQMAKKIWVQNCKSKIVSIRAELESDSNRVEAIADLVFGGVSNSTPPIYSGF